MKNQLLKITSFLVILFIGMHGYGQGYSLETYLDSLQHKNAHLLQSKNKIREAAENIKMAKAAFLPSVGATASYRRDFDYSYIFLSDLESSLGDIESYLSDWGIDDLPDKFAISYKNNISAGVVAEQSIYNPAVGATIKLAKLSEEYSKLSHTELSEEIQKQGALLFWQALYAKESLKVMKENEELAKQQWTQFSDLYEQGVVSEFEKQQAKIYHKQTIPRVHSVQTLYENLLNELKVLANIAPDAPFEISGNINLLDNEMTLFNTGDEALQNNTSLAILSKQLELNKQQIKEKQTAYYPTLKAQLGYSFDTYNDEFKFNNVNKVPYGQLLLSIPIFSGGYNNANVKKAEINFSNAQLNRHFKQLELQKELINTQNDLSVAIDKINTESELIELSEREIDIAKEKIKLGMLTNLELKEIRLSLIRAKLNRLNACLDYRTAQIKLKKITGKI
ncbi:TolC family protein [uncultured Draconibacterium sp.]|uniref:TolC family protein n=1 Tax=uncultured Draconibacterium sp. TaxID=1573823 RepID=UPI0025EE69E2|nr:TolC family protein [uncultured Draconibacterium sp.]